MLLRDSGCGLTVTFPMFARTITSGKLNLVLRRKIIRYAFGIFLCSAIAFGIGWPVSYLSIVLVNVFLLGKEISFKAGINFLMQVIIAVVFSLLITTYLLSYQLIFSLLIGLILLLIFYLKDSQVSPILKTWLLISVLLIPFVSLIDPSVGQVTGLALIVGTVVAIGVTWIAQGLFPDIKIETHDEHQQAVTTPDAKTPYDRYVAAIKRTAVVYPVVLLFYYFDLQSGALILIYIGMYSSFPGFAKDLSVGKLLLLGCIIGGIIALLLYEIVALVPIYTFLLLLMFGFALWAGDEILLGRKYASQIKAGFSTIIIIFGSAVGSDDVDAGGEVFIRFIQVSSVVVYLVVAFGLLEKFFPEKVSTKLSLKNKSE